MSTPTNAQLSLNEARIQLALQVIKQDANLSVRRAAAIYNVPHSTLADRHAGMASQRDWKPKSKRLLETEEQVIIQHILDLDSRGFPPRLATVKDMADSLLAARHQDPVGVKWAGNFVRRTPELKIKFN
jgi:hypothetical protein